LSDRRELLPYVPVELYRSAMVRRWGPQFHLLGLSFILRKLRLDPTSVERVRQAAQRGPVVYVLHTRSGMDYLALNEVLRRARLPLAEYGTAVSTTAWIPLLAGLRLARDKLTWFFKNGRLPNPVDVGWLGQLVSEGRNAAIFLRRDQRLKDVLEPRDWPDPVRALVAAQARCERPIQLLPVVVVWQRKPRHAELGQRPGEEPGGRPDKLIELALGRRDGVVQIGEPVVLSEYLERYPEPEDRQARRLTRALRLHLRHERRVLNGPTLEPAEEVRRRVLTSAPVQEVLRTQLASGGRAARVKRQLVKTYDRMAARFSFQWVGLGETFMRWLWRVVFSGVEVPEADLERIRKAQRDGVAVLLPNHRSHLDYVLLSWVLHRNSIMLPHVVAGANLDFWPIGGIFRSLGAVFIKRSFKGEALFPTVFRAYLVELFRARFTLEFFLEGGRSRTGRTLPPRIGVLAETVHAGLKAGLERPHGEVSWLPISITYEQIAEEEPYARELGGATKERESVRGLMRASRSLLQRYGRVHVRVGEPVKLSEWVETEARWPDEPKEALKDLGRTVLSRVDRGLVVLPTGLVALGVLAQSRSAVPTTVLRSRCARLLQVLEAQGAERATTLRDVNHGIDEALARFEKGKLITRVTGADDVVWQPQPDKRITLEYYKNALLHWLVPGSLVAAAVRANGQDRFVAADVAELVAFQRHALRLELVRDPAEGDLVGPGLDQLCALGAIEATEAGFEVVQRARVSELAECTSTLLESQFLVIRCLPQLPSGELGALARKVQKQGQPLLAVEDVRRPESLSLVTLKAALQALEQDGIWRAGGGGGLVVDQSRAVPFERTLRHLLRMNPAGLEERLQL
jgi:glycerol-3-phosphate O-acyltransferase